YGVTGDNDSPITVHSHTAREVLGAKVGNCLPGLVEARIEVAVCIVADETKIIVFAVDERVPCDDNLSVPLHRHTFCVALLGDGSCYLSGVPEARVEVAVRAVP